MAGTRMTEWHDSAMTSRFDEVAFLRDIRRQLTKLQISLRAHDDKKFHLTMNSAINEIDHELAYALLRLDLGRDW